MALGHVSLVGAGPGDPELWTVRALRRVQGSMDPVTNPFVREFARRAVVRTAIIAGLVGMLLGAVLMMVVRRRRDRRV